MFGWCLVVVTELRMVQNFFSRLLAINTAKQKIILKNEMCLIAISPLYTSFQNPIFRKPSYGRESLLSRCKDSTMCYSLHIYSNHSMCY